MSTWSMICGRKSHTRTHTHTLSLYKQNNSTDCGPETSNDWFVWNSIFWYLKHLGEFMTDSLHDVQSLGNIFAIDGMWFTIPLDQGQCHKKNCSAYNRNGHFDCHIFILLLDNSNHFKNNGFCTFSRIFWRIFVFVRLIYFCYWF